MDFRILGPFEAHADDRVLTLGGARLRAFAATLLVNTNQTVTAQQLGDSVWPKPPRALRSLVRTYAAQLRAALTAAGDSAGRLTSEPTGYRLRLEPGELDVSMFEDHVSRGEQARSRREHAEAATALWTALRLWRGEPLAGLDYGPGLSVQVARLAERRLVVAGNWADAALAAGHADKVAAELAHFVRENPFHEQLWAHLMQALWHAGRRGDALAAYQQLYRLLTDELGIEPGPALQGMHQTILAGGAAGAESQLHQPTARPVRQLPADVAHFVGRAREAEILDGALSTCATTAAVVAISGMAGIGKTSLALRWAHRAADRFPDGQFHIDLRGFHPSGHVVTPPEALHGFLVALGVTAKAVPIELDARARLFRSLLAGRRVLVVLDNARDADHVRPLLPGSCGCLALVTSRNELTSLVAIEQAQPVPLDALPDQEASELLGLRIGAQRLAAEPIAARSIVQQCAGLPLALAIVAARAAVNPRATLAGLVAEFDDEAQRLSGLRGGDLSTDMRAVFASSYGALSAPAARLFRLLGLHPGNDIGLDAAARLAGLPVTRTRQLLDELCGINMVRPAAPGRYTCHDLLSAYARELGASGEQAVDREAAVIRVLDHYLHRAHAAYQQLYEKERGALTLPAALSDVTSFADSDAAEQWLAVERTAMVAAICELDICQEYLWPLARAIAMDLERDGRWSALLATTRRALEITGRLGDLSAHADACRDHAMALWRVLDHEGTLEYYGREVELRRQLGDHTREARAILEMTGPLEALGRYQEALDHSGRSLELSRRCGSRSGEVSALNAMGWFKAHLGEYELGLEYCGRSARLAVELGLPKFKADALDSLGYSLRGLGRYDEAVAHYQQAAVIYQQQGDRFNYAAVLDCIGDCLQASGDAMEAKKAWHESIAIFELLDHPEADRIRAKSTAP